ncbi:DNA recombination protein RmuC [Novosphingobium sp. Gsoil 351]|uniref:DNA recombination protein RmuC n=1 Tax=Novosphingobium sp. Gsoil 351 TaxID=2675225 RepID=UPI0012B4AAB1|nr:DNA recombination protein RmuC [Novosphingobium sp. Gsoil 351]QGN53288.1 DNA recombination protein RmuC [Novosphingobium sp. Gsoil 351]
MNPTVIALIALCVGLLAGTALGWFAGSRPAAVWRARHAERDAEAREVGERLARMVPELATMSERAARADSMANDLDRAREDREGLRAEIARLRADAANFADRERLLIEARELLLKEFQNAGAKVLEGAQKSFLDRAGERFAQSEDKNEARIKALLEPVGAKLTLYEEQVRKLERERVDAFGNLSGLIEGMRAGQEAIRAEAQRLGNSLTNAPKARGRWGERALQNVLEQCGLTEHTDFDLEHSIDTEDGRLRPDAIVHVPGQKKLVIDAKVSLNAYQAAFESNDDAERKRHFDLHARSMRNHVQTLGAKGYQSQFAEAPDYVVMFVPGEHFVSAALEHDPELWDFAFRNKVLLATPTNLVAIARTVAMVWKQDTIAREAVEIGRAGGELYDRLATAAEHLKGMGGGLDRAVRKYNDFVGSFERNVLTSGRRLRDKGIEIGKREIEDVPLVDALPRHGDVMNASEPGEALLIEEAASEAARDTG